MSAFTYEINRDGIAILTFDLPGDKFNKLTSAVIEELSTLLSSIATHSEIRALIIRSGKEDSFIVGADIAEIRSIHDTETGERLARKGQAVLAQLASLPFPTVAAIHGPCMGGGMELALACDFRVISNDQRTALALPEVRLGIIPGFGGTQRLPRLIGLTNALDMILTGKSIYAIKAEKIGLADETTYKEILLTRAKDLASKAIGKPKPTAIRAKTSLKNMLIEDNPITRLLICNTVKRNIWRNTRGNIPAPLAALESIRYGLAHKQEAGYANEAKLLGQLAPSEISKNLISVFYLNEMLKRNPAHSQYIVSRAGVLGAGIMGGAIAQLFAEKGIVVDMKDISAKVVGTGLREAWDIFNKRRGRGILTALQARNGFDRLTGTTDYSGFKNVNIAVEAVNENMDIKKKVLREFEQVAPASAIFASNTSSLSITDLASVSQHPDRVVGMHFFHPVEKMSLVEVIRAEKTSPETVATIITLSRRLGKLPVVVNDGPGFLVNRILMTYLNEAATMLDEGGLIGDIDKILLTFGMPMGAFILLDEIGIDIASKVAGILEKGLGGRIKPSPLLSILYRDGFFGKKNGKGFYRYDGKKRLGPDESIYNKIAARSRNQKNINAEEVVDRAVLMMIKEAALCLEEEIVTRQDMLDAALIFGIGFPPFRGGLLRYADKLGVRSVVEKLERLANKYSPRFAPPKLLLDMASRGRGFYHEQTLGVALSS